MAIDWGPWEYSGGNGMRVGLEVSWSAGDGTPIDHSSAKAKATVKVYTDTQYTYSGNVQKLSYGGSISGSTTFTNNQSGGSGGVLRDTKTYFYDYGANEYGTSPGSRTFTASLSGAYNGVTPSQSVTSKIPARPYGLPANPTNVDVNRVSDTSQKITWTNKATSGEPWEWVWVDRDVNDDNTWNNIGTPGGGSTSFTDSGTSANQKLRYRVQAHNSIGNSSTRVETGLIFTTPSAPSSATRTQSGADQVVTWANKGGYTEYNTEIWRSVNGVYSLLATVGSGITSYTDVAPDASAKIKYKVRHKTTSGVQGTLYSAYTADTSETAGVTSPPAAPTKLSPTGGSLILTGSARIFTWQFNPTDGSAQTGYQIRWRVVGAASWTTRAAVSSSVSSWTAPANTFPDASNIEWQVSTKGANAAYGPFSASGTFSTVGDSNAGRGNKRGLWLNLETGKMETAPVGSFVPIGTMLKWGPANVPPGYLLCDGRAVSRTTYSDLFGVIGTKFGAGDGSTTFNLPFAVDTTLFDQPYMRATTTDQSALPPSSWQTRAGWGSSAGAAIETIGTWNFTSGSVAVPRDGDYRINAVIQVDHNGQTTGRRMARILLRGTSVSVQVEITAGSWNSGFSTSIPLQHRRAAMKAGQSIAIQGWQANNNNASTSFGGLAIGNIFEVEWLGYNAGDTVDTSQTPFNIIKF